MKLSEAILLGSINNGQAFGRLKDTVGNTCAMGAAMEAVGETLPCGHWLGDDRMACEKRTIARWPILIKTVEHPIPGEISAICWLVIVSLNNFHKWTRPQIAAWVAELEQQMEAQAHPQVETVDAIVG